MSKKPILFFPLLLVVALYSCKPSQQASNSSGSRRGLTEKNNTDFTYLFHNANKEKILGNYDLEMLFNHPLVKQYIQMPNVIDHLRCRKICSANVAGSSATNFFGDGWVMVGDLTGYGRALKDGYFAALQSADLAARTLMFHGSSEEAFRHHYLKPLSKLTFDNLLGMLLFHIDRKVVNGPIGNLLVCTALAEMGKNAYGGLVTAAFRALFTGELSYKTILGLYVSGLAARLFRGR